MRILAFASLFLAGVTALAAEDPAPKKKDAEPSAVEVDVAKATETIVRDATAAGKRLAEKDPGDSTQKHQQDALKNLDALIRKAQEPPPPPKQDDASPSPKKDGKEGNPPPKDNTGMGGMSKSPAGGPQQQGGSSARREQRQKNRQAQGGGTQTARTTSQQMGTEPRLDRGGTAGRPASAEPKGLPPRIPDVYKDVWGHLPEKMRQEMDLYFREQFMPRYSDLLRQYYSSLAERSGKPAVP
jgi:hypothetical protein